MKNPNAQALGSLGGKKTLEKRGKDYFRELSKKGIDARKAKKLIQKDIVDNRGVGTIN